MRIALLQIAPTGSLEGNLRKGLDCCRKAKALSSDIALFPEMWSIGYDIYSRPPEVWMDDAIDTDHPFVSAFAKEAKNLEMAIGITLLEKTEEGVRNSLMLFDRHGERKLLYAKVHTCDFGAERSLTPGNDFPVADLDTKEGMVKVGAMICYDREAPGY